MMKYIVLCTFWNYTKERKLGYKINTDITDPKKYPYLGIKECLEYDINDDWCQDCNDESGELLLWSIC